MMLTESVWDRNPPVSPSTPPVYVELKTSKAPQKPRDHVNFERKLLRFWAQSFLLGVSKIVVGYRDDNGILQSLQELETQGIPGIAKRSGRKLWDGKLSIDFTTSLLEWIKDIVGCAPEGTFWRIRHKEDSNTVELSVVHAESFLSPLFLQWRNGL
jgi:RAT1-interacting protein